jgi:hypothetical protein
MSLNLRFYVPFEAQKGQDAQYALKEKLLNIEGVAIDTSVNANKWSVLEEDLRYIEESLKAAQLRVDHAESALMIVGKVTDAWREGGQVKFRAEVGEEKLIEKILRGYITHVSAQVDSDDVECSKCQRLTRKEGVLIHLCPGAWEVVHKPKVRELSIVASPAYKNTSFQPLGFAAAMNDGQWDAIVKSVTNSQLPPEGNNVGSKRKLQEPENKNDDTQREVKHLSENAQQAASPHQAQGAINVAPGETAPKQVQYEDYMNKLQQLKKEIYEAETAEADAEIDTLKKRVAEMEAELAKKATKRQLSKKLSELSKKMSEEAEEAEEGEEVEDGEEGEEGGPKPKGPIDVVSKRKKGEEGEEAEASRRAGGKGIVAVDEIQKDALNGPNYDWFTKDLMKAHKRLVGFR